jgi:hypothetical protein
MQVRCEHAPHDSSLSNHPAYYGRKTNQIALNEVLNSSQTRNPRQILNQLQRATVSTQPLGKRARCGRCVTAFDPGLLMKSPNDLRQRFARAANHAAARHAPI